MPEQTERLGLWTFEDGDTDWDHTDTVTLFDRLAIQRDSITERPETGAYPNQLFYATDPDELALYRWDADAGEWAMELVAPENIQPEDLGFDTATQGELDGHADTADAHHSRYTDDEVESVVRALIKVGYGKRPYKFSIYGMDV